MIFEQAERVTAKAGTQPSMHCIAKKQINRDNSEADSAAIPPIGKLISELELRWLSWLSYRLIFLYFDNTNQVMQNPISKLRKSSIISEKSGYLSEKLKTWTSSSYHRVLNFLLKFFPRLILNNICKWAFGIFFLLLFYLDLELLIKM